MDDRIQLRTINELRYYLMAEPCPACGKGPWLACADATPAANVPSEVEVRCEHCSKRRRIAFVCEHPVPSDGPESELINPTDEPSRVVDLAQWLSLFYGLLESASAQRQSAATRRAGYRAALCLAEALKFYEDDELPPATAFYSDRTRETFREHPESFARQRLRDMQAKLPTLGAMARRLKQDKRMRRPWWKFWKPA